MNKTCQMDVTSLELRPEWISSSDLVSLDFRLFSKVDEGLRSSVGAEQLEKIET